MSQKTVKHWTKLFVPSYFLIFLNYKIACLAYVTDVRQLFWAMRISTNQSDEDWHHAPDSCTLEVFSVSPKREFAHFYLALFNKFILKKKNTFWKQNRHRHLWIGKKFDAWSNDRFCAWSQAIRTKPKTKGSVIFARDHAQLARLVINVL